MIDADSVRRHLLDIERHVAVLRRHRDRNAEELTRPDAFETLLAIERALQIAVQNALDVGAHVLSAGAINDVDEYKDVPRKLAAHGIIPADLGDYLVGAAGLRNLLAHHYLVVQVPLLLPHLADGPDRFAEFARHVEAYLQRGEGGGEPG